MNRHDLELAGAILYKCEGTKLRKDKRYKNTYLYQIEFTNSEPYLIELFVKFIREILFVDEEKLKCELFLYPDMDINKIKDKWNNITKIKLLNFQKVVMMKPKISKFKPNPLGTCKIRYNSKSTFLKMNQIIIKTLGLDASLVKYEATHGEVG